MADVRKTSDGTIVPVILSGGAGTRLWPVSREAHPKPFMRLPDGDSLLQATLRRAADLPGVERVLTLTNRDYFFQTRDEYAAVVSTEGPALAYLLEPMGRNTAPAIALAAFCLRESIGDEAVMLVLPADHVIADGQRFGEAVSRARSLASEGALVTFGIRPTRAETGYGYIEQGKAVAVPDGKDGAFEARRFVEKPDATAASEYLRSGRFLWNAGMFCFRADTLLGAVERHAPEVFEAASNCWAATRRDGDPVELNAAEFGKLPSISIDYAVMERAEDVVTVPCEFDWSDLGSWDAVSALAEADGAGNRLIGEALAVDTRDCYLHSDDRLVATLGVEGLVVVDTPDALLVAARERCQDVKELVQRLRDAGHESYKYHRTVHRPWGTYTVLEEGDRFKIKRIVVKPEASLSLQMHHHRSEHWIVVSGTAEVVNGDRNYLVRTNESTYVPAGNRHRLRNPGIVELVLIEVQSGEYLGEDDIVRFDDEYGRFP